MKLSIIIPVYNVEAYVGQTLVSVFDTTASLEEFEVIVVNDGTEDKSMEVVRQYADRSNLVILEQENQGLSAARNRGLDQAKGDYVWFVDSDDWLVEDGVGKVLRLLEERPGVEVLMTPLLRKDPRYPDQGCLDYRIDQERALCGKEAFLLGILPSFGWIMRFVINRSFLISNYWLRFPVGLLHEDTYFGAVLMYSAKCVSILTEPIYEYRVFRPGSIVSSPKMERTRSHLEVYRRLKVFMAKRVDPNDRDWFQAYCFNIIAKCYDARLFNDKGFKAFTQNNGEYLYRQWKGIHPNASVITRIGRRLFYRNPKLYRKIKIGFC